MLNEVSLLFARTISGTVSGYDGRLVHVEVDISRGLPLFDIVGLPDASVKESRERVRAALRNAGFPFPVGRIVVNLAPADLPKSGPACDLAIALAILAAGGSLPADRLQTFCIIGELSLDGRLRRVPGLLPIVLTAVEQNMPVLAASEAGEEAALVPGIAFVAAETLHDAVQWFRRGGPDPRPGEIVRCTAASAATSEGGSHPSTLSRSSVGSAPKTPGDAHLREDLGDVKGQDAAKRALEIAAAGGHNLLMIGPPGVGKTMLARRLPTILPPLDRREHLDVCRIYSIAGLLDSALVAGRRRPFRAPHHSATKAGLLGGARGIPGEAALAHHGVLFLDELSEFPRPVLEALRQPLEDGVITLARLPRPIRFPAEFSLVAATNPCPCGYYGDDRRECRCREHAVAAYRNKLSGPLADRIDLAVELRAPAWADLAAPANPEDSARVRARVMRARDVQRRRFGEGNIRTNGSMGQTHLRRYGRVEPAAESMLQFAADSLRLSVRALNRTVKVARTIADLAGSGVVRAVHVQEALAFRTPFDDSLQTSSIHTHLPRTGGGSR